MGLIILPDEDCWELPDGLSFTSGCANGYATNTYSYSELARMEAAGAVFLPAAGGRDGVDVKGVGSGYYWYSSCVSSGLTSSHELFFGGGQVVSDFIHVYCSSGRSVRLVADN